MPEPAKQDDRAQTFRTLGLVGQLGWWMVALILAGFAAGYHLDQWLDTGPLFMLLLLLLGIAGGFWKAYRLIMKHIR